MDFDPLSMPYIQSPMGFNGVGSQNLDFMSATSGMDFQDQYSNFDSEAYMRCVQIRGHAEETRAHS